MPHRTRWRLRLRSPRARRVARGFCVGILALPAGLLAAATPIERAPVPAQVLRLSEEPTATLAKWLPASTAAIIKNNNALRRWMSRHKPFKSEGATRAIARALAECGSRLGEKQRWRIARAIEGEAERAGYDPLFVQALVEVESTCTPTARSPRGALGLTQVRPDTARAVVRDAGMQWRGAHSLLDPETNLRVGLLYLTQLYDKYGDIHVAMAAYNLGPGRAGSMSRDRARRSRYVRKILERYEDLLAASASGASTAVS